MNESMPPILLKHPLVIYCSSDITTRRFILSHLTSFRSQTGSGIGDMNLGNLKPHLFNWISFLLAYKVFAEPEN